MHVNKGARCLIKWRTNPKSNEVIAFHAKSQCGGESTMGAAEQHTRIFSLNISNSEVTPVLQALPSFVSHVGTLSLLPLFFFSASFPAKP